MVNSADDVVWGSATHAPIYAVADGVTVFVLDAGSEGQIVAIEHRLADGSTVYSIYWHVGHVQVGLQAADEYHGDSLGNRPYERFPLPLK